MRDFFTQRSFAINFVKLNLMILAFLFTLGQTSFAQTIDPKDYHVTNETIRTNADGKLSVSLPTSYSGAILMMYEYKMEGNFQKRDKLKAKGGRISIDNLHPGKYFNIKFYDMSNNLLGLIDKFYLDYGVEIKAIPNLRTLCGTLTFTDCNGTTVTQSGLEQGKAYPFTTATAPCGFEVSSTCTIVNKDYWHCLDGNLSAPAPYTAYDLTNYAGIGMTALAAARVAWIICNYGLPTADTDPVSIALWYLAGTGGSANAVYDAAVNAVTSPNGTEANLQFYRSLTGTTQDYVRWECPLVCNSTPLSMCGTNITQMYNVLSSGTYCNPDSWTADEHVFSVQSGPNAGAYQIKPGTTPKVIEYSDGTVKAIIEVSFSYGTVGSVDNTRGYIIEVTGSQRTVGTPGSGLTAATSCGISPQSSWIYYNSYQMKACGTGSNSLHNFIVNGPTDGANHPFQIGAGANTWNSSLGGGIWFTNVGGGDLTFRLVPVSPLTVNAGADATVCYGQSKTLTAVGSGGMTPYSYAWSDGLANGASRTNAGPYSVTVTDNAGCTNTDAVVLTVNPQLTLSMPNISVCSGPNFLVTANASGGTPGYTYNWSSGLGTGNSKSIPATTATYTVTVTDSKGCTAVDPFDVTVTNGISPTINGANIICQGMTSTFTATGGGTYLWNTGATSASINVSAEASYNVTVTDINGCTGTANRYLTVNPNPTVIVSNDGPLTCTKTSVTLTATGGGTYAWSGGGTGSTKVVTSAGTYSVIVTGSNNCTASNSTTVDYTPSSTQVNAGYSTTVCAGDGIIYLRGLTSGTTSTLWSTTGSGTFLNASSLNTTYTMSAADKTSGSVSFTLTGSSGACAPASETITITIRPEPTVTLSTSSSRICVGDNVSVSANNVAGYAYKWYGPNGFISNSSTLSITNAQLSNSGMYYLVVQDSYGCINNVTTSTFKLAVDDDYCITEVGNYIGTTNWNQTINVNKFNGNCGSLQSINYSTSGILINLNGIESFANGSSTGSIAFDGLLTVNNPEGGNLQTNLDVSHILNFATFDGMVDFDGLSGERKNLNVYSYNTGSSSNYSTYTGTGTVAFPSNVNVNYNMTLSGGNNELLLRTWAGADVVIHYCYSSPLNLVNKTACAGSNVSWTATGNNNFPYVWTKPDGTTFTGNPLVLNNVTTAQTGTYTVTQDGCGDCIITSKSAVLTVSPAVTATITGNNTICAGTSTTLTASGGSTYAWSTGSNAASISVSSANTYTVTVTNSSGCTGTSAMAVSVTTNPTASITGNQTVCPGSSSTFTASGGTSYLWSTGANTASISVSSAGTYTVTVTSSGCTASSSRSLTVASKPTANITATGNNCITSNAQLFGTATGGTPGYTYAYTGPNGFSSTQQNPTISQNGTYTLIVTDQNGCTDDVNIIIFNEFLPTAISASSALCSGESTVLTASGGGTYAWSSNAGGGSSNQTTVTPSSTTTYTVTVTSTNGCVATATVQVVVYAKPVVTNIATVQNTSCNNTSNTGSITVTATGQSGLTMQYRINGGAWQSSNIFNNLGNGTYNVEVSYVERACYSNPASATISSQSGLSVLAENDKTVCPSTNFTLSATATGGTTPYTYGWTGGLIGTPATASGITNTQTYVVTVTDNKGCTATDNVVVSVHPLPIASIAIDGQLTCAKTTSQLTASPGTGVNYLWNISNQTTRTINVSTPGTYTVTVTSTTTGCASSTSFTVTQDITKPNVNAGSDKILTCTVTSIALNGSSTTSGATFAWVASNGGNIVSGGNTATPTVNAAGTYTLTVTNPTNGCTETDVATVTLNNTPPANVTADNVGGPLTCIDNSVTISAYPDISTYTYAWSGPAGYTSTTRVNNVSVDGNYTVTVTNSVNGCTSTANTTVTKNVTIPTAYAGGDRTICNGTNTTLTATGNGVYLWSNNMTTASITVNPTITTTYTVTVTGTNGCTNTSQAVVTVTPLPASGLTGPTEVCMDEYGVFSASPVVSGATYTWTFDGGTSFDGDANDPTESVKWASSYANTTRTVTLVVTKDNCTSTYTKAVLVKQGAYLNTQALYPVCQGGTVQIGPNPNDPAQVTPGSSFQWTPNLFLNNNTVARPLSTPPFDIQYTLTATVNGCATSMQITVDVNVNLNPIADAGADKVICLTESTTIGGTPTATPPPTGGATISGVLWTVPPSSTITSTLNNPLVSPTLNTQYRVVVVASNGCTDTDFVNVTVNPKQKIGNYTWIDSNKDGCQTSGEVGLNGVTVSLYTAAGTLVTTATTSNNPTNGLAGYYQFEVCPGNYYVNFGQPTGYIFTGKNICGDVPSNSDANTTNGNVDPFTIVSGQDNFTIDAGFIAVGNIRGTVTTDTNNDNIGDTPLANVTINLKDLAGNIVATDVTDASGNYEFLNIPVGQYTIMQVQPTGYNSISDVDATPDPDGNDGATPDNMIPVTVTTGENDNDNNFVEEQTANIRGNVTADTNNDNIGDSPLANVTINLKDLAGNIVATDVTDASGNYEFLGVAPGQYTIMEVQPTGYNSVSDVDATPDPDGNDGTTPNDMIPVTVTAGENDNDNNLVEEQTANIRGNVTADTNNDNTGDSPLANVTINLKDLAGNIVATDVTDASGNYEFLNVAPGQYTIMEVQPTGYNSVSDVDATPDPDGNDGTTPNDMIPVTVTAGENDNDNNLVEEQTGSIRGTVTKDTNNDNVGDSPLANVTINLKDLAGNILATDVTDASGNYEFLNVAPGQYTIMEVQPTGYNSVSDVDATPDPDGNDGSTPNDMIPVTVTAGENDNDNNLVEEQTGSIRGTVTKDTNNDNVGDSPLANVTINLKDLAGNIVATDVTDASGNYEFLNVAPGQYTIMEVQPTGYNSVSDVDATPDPDGNDGTTPNDMIPVTVTAGENDNDNNFIEENLASLGNYVWEDKDADGIQEAGEPGIANVVVRLFNSAGIQVAFKVTDNSGYYLFANLVPGTYTVKFDKPAGYESTSKDLGADNTIDSDADMVTGITVPVVLNGGEDNLTVDAGFYKLAKIGNFVWEDKKRQWSTGCL